MNYVFITFRQLYSFLSVVIVTVLITAIIYRSLAAERSLTKRTDALQQLVASNRQTVESMRSMLQESMRNANAMAENNNSILKNLQEQITGISNRLDRLTERSEAQGRRIP